MSKESVCGLNDKVEVYDPINGVVVWTGVVTAISPQNGIITVRADTAVDRLGRPLAAKFSKGGGAVGRYGPYNRNVRRKPSNIND